MYGSAAPPKDLNLPATQPPAMSSPGLLRYRSAPSNLLGEVCVDGFPEPAAGHRPDHAATDAVLTRFLACHNHHDEISDTKPPRPAAPAHFVEDAAASMASQSHQQQHHHQQLMYQSQQQMAAMEGLYRAVSSGGCVEPAVAAAAGNNLLRQSSSPAGFLNHFNMDTGYASMLRAGMDVGGFRAGGDARLKGQLSFSSRQGSVMSQISEVGSEELDGGGNSSPEAGCNGGARGYVAGVPGYGVASSGWDEPSPKPGVKRPRDVQPGGPDPTAAAGRAPPQLNGKPSAEMAALEKLLQFQDAVPCKIRAKRGCATHPRSIAERVRRTRISERIRKLQELVPNMEKQTNTADMLDLAVEYIKDLQKQVKVLNDGRANCTCSATAAAGRLQHQFAG